jgi:hypothetical protein
VIQSPPVPVAPGQTWANKANPLVEVVIAKRDNAYWVARRAKLSKRAMTLLKGKRYQIPERDLLKYWRLVRQ